MHFILASLGVLVLLLVNEAWWRRQPKHSELNRKFVHITVGSFVAFWPYFLSWEEIRFLSLSFLVVVGVSRYLQIFRAIHSVQRPTAGEFFFAIAVGLLSFAQHHPHIYTAALLTMSLADGLAAIVGTQFGRHIRYKVFGSYKSFPGSLTFFIVCGLILVVYSHTTKYIAAYEIDALAIGATILENLGVYGSDNLLVPLLIGGVLLLF